MLTCVSVSSDPHTFLNNATVYLIVPIPFKIADIYVSDKFQDVREMSGNFAGRFWWKP